MKRHPIRIVSLRTGLSKDVLRAWERRYDVVQPDRTETGRRLYSDDDIDYLRLLRKASSAGRGLKQMAELSRADLTRLVDEDETARELRQAEEAGSAAGGVPGGRTDAMSATPQELVVESLAAVEALDRDWLHATLNRSVVTLPPALLVEEMIAPLMRRIGEMWWEQRLSPRHEHLASTAVRMILEQVIGTLERRGSDRPHLVCATPDRQRHEIGAMLVAVTAAAAGWRVTFLGADLPVEEIAEAAVSLDAHGVAISLVHPDDDPELPVAIRRLRRLLLPETRLFAGGQAAAAYREALEDAGAEVFGDLLGLRLRLAELHAGSPSVEGPGTESGSPAA